MKKKYFSPETAAMEVQFTSVLCGSGDSNVNNDQLNYDSGNSSMDGAPGRKKVF